MTFAFSFVFPLLICKRVTGLPSIRIFTVWTAHIHTPLSELDHNAQGGIDRAVFLKGWPPKKCRTLFKHSAQQENRAAKENQQPQDIDNMLDFCLAKQSINDKSPVSDLLCSLCCMGTRTVFRFATCHSVTTCYRVGFSDSNIKKNFRPLNLRVYTVVVNVDTV